MRAARPTRERERAQVGAQPVVLVWDAATLAQHVAAVVAMLEHSDWYVRRSAMEVLGKLDAAHLAPHAHAIVGMLQHEDGAVRLAAVEALA